MTKRSSRNKRGEKYSKTLLVSARLAWIMYSTTEQEGQDSDLLVFEEVSRAGLTIALCQDKVHNPPRK